MPQQDDEENPAARPRYQAATGFVSMDLAAWPIWNTVADLVEQMPRCTRMKMIIRMIPSTKLKRKGLANTICVPACQGAGYVRTMTAKATATSTSSWSLTRRRDIAAGNDRPKPL